MGSGEVIWGTQDVQSVYKLPDSQNHGMDWIEKDLKDPLVLNPLLWAGTPFTRPGSSNVCKLTQNALPLSGSWHLHFAVHLHFSRRIPGEHGQENPDAAKSKQRQAPLGVLYKPFAQLRGARAAAQQRTGILMSLLDQIQTVACLVTGSTFFD